MSDADVARRWVGFSCVSNVEQNAFQRGTNPSVRARELQATLAMQLPIQVTFRVVPHSDAVEQYVRRRAAKLETFSPRITSCRVVVESPHMHSQSGRHFRVRVDLTVPGGEVVVGHAPGDEPTNEDLYAAIDNAFDRVGRRLEDHQRRQRGDIKHREAPYQEGRVTKLWSYEGYGFIEPFDGPEVYFHRHSVRHGAFDRIQIGSSVRFVEEAGENGPQASTVVFVK
jgi:ribosomal subunit interface protein